MQLLLYPLLVLSFFRAWSDSSPLETLERIVPWLLGGTLSSYVSEKEKEKRLGVIWWKR